MIFSRQSPPPFYQAQLNPAERERLDRLFIGPRSTRHYLKAFAKFDRQQRMGMHWNWAALVMTIPWMLYRKRYLDVLVYAIAIWSFVHVAITLVLVVTENAVVPFVDAAWHWPLRAAITLLGLGAFYVWTALWADAYYYRVARREISEALEARLGFEAQATHLAHEGGVSLWGAGVALGLIVLASWVVRSVYLPLYVDYQTRAELGQVLDNLEPARERLEQIYQTSGVCPVGLDLSTAEQRRVSSLTVSQRLTGVPSDSPCQITAYLPPHPWPMQHLTQQHLSFYRLGADRSNAPLWVCSTSLSRHDAPPACRSPH